jgi:hypothetical protein
MSGYLQFGRTGHKEVDDILQMIENTGQSYHHTSQWGDNENGAPSHIDQINEKIRAAKTSLNKHQQDIQQ